MNSLDVRPIDRSSWWARPAGGREVLRVSVPLVISSLSWTVMTFVDRMLLNQVSGAAMTATFAASAVWFMTICLPLGVCAYANTFVAQYDGARQHRQIGLVVWQSIWIALFFTPLLIAAIPLAPTVFAAAKHAADVTQYEIQYFQIISLGGPAMLVAQGAAAFYSGRGKTEVVMWTDAAFALLNVALDVIWIFGYLGFPAMGVAGAAWATVLSMWLKAVAYLLLMLQRSHREQYGTLAGLRFDRALLQRLSYFGGPSGMQMLLDVAGWTVFIVMVGRLGSVAAEATSVAFSVSTLAFMPVWGFHLAVSVLVGERLGEDRDDLAVRATYTTLLIAGSYIVVVSLLFLFTPQLFLYGFYPQAESLSSEAQTVRDLAATLLRFVAAYCLFDMTLMIFAGAIKGAGDTQFVMRLSLVLAIALAALSWLGVEVWQFGVYGCWMLITAWIWAGAIAYVLRFRQGKWRSMRVIEASDAAGEIHGEA